MYRQLALCLCVSVCCMGIGSISASAQSEEDGFSPAHLRLMKQAATCGGGGQKNVEEAVDYNERTTLVEERSNENAPESNQRVEADLKRKITNECR